MASRKQPPEPGPKPKARRPAPPPPAPAIGRRLAGALRSSGSSARTLGPVLFGVAVIAAAVWLGARQGREQRNAGFDTAAPTVAAAPLPPFRSDQDEVRTLSDKDAFAHSCGTCHTLKAAGVTAGIGPNLDRTTRRLTFAVVREQIRTGSIDTAMPSNLLIGRDADRVARYVARVAGTRG